jgi:hypothetical protein
LQEREDARDRLRAADLPQRPQGHEAHLRVRVVEQRDQVRRGGRVLELAQREHRLLAHEAALVAERLPETLGHAGGLELPQRLDRRPPHGLPRVLGERHQGGGRPRLPQQTQRLRRPDADLGLGAGERLQQERHHPLRAHPGERGHGALLDQLALVAEQLEQQHGRVLVAQPSDRGGGLGADLGRGVVDERSHQLDPAAGGDPGEAADRPLPDRVVGVGQAVDVGLAVAEADGDERVGHVLLERGLAQQVDQRTLRPGLLEPAQRDGGGAPVLDVFVLQRRQQVRDQVLAAQRLLDAGIEALAAGRGPLLDRHHRLDRRVADGRVGIVEVGDEIGQRLTPGQAADRVQHRAPQHLVAQQLEQGRSRPRVPDLRQRVDGGVLEPGLGAQDLHQRQHRPLRAQLSEAGGGGMAHVDVRIA